MNTLVVWNNGTNLAFYQIPSALVAPYFAVQGVCIRPDQEGEDQTERTIEHLAIMLGQHDYAADSLPGLNTWLEEKQERVQGRPTRRQKIVDAMWAKYQVGANMEIDSCERILHTGWLDIETGEREAVEAHVNQQTDDEGGGGVGGDDRGEVKNPATDKRLKQHGGGSRGRQSGPAAGKGRQGGKK